MTDIRKVAAFNSLKNFFEDNNLTVFIGVASRECEGLSIDALRAKSESQIRQMFKPSKQGGEGVSESDVTELVDLLKELSPDGAGDPAKHSAAVCLG